MTIEEAREKKQELEKIIEDDIYEFLRDNKELNLTGIQVIFTTIETHCGIIKDTNVIATVTI